MNIEVESISEASGATASKVRKDIQRGHLDRMDLGCVSLYVVLTRLKRDGFVAKREEEGC